jgi:hypothetical protein
MLSGRINHNRTFLYVRSRWSKVGSYRVPPAKPLWRKGSRPAVSIISETPVTLRYIDDIPSRPKSRVCCGQVRSCGDEIPAHG